MFLHLSISAVLETSEVVETKLYCSCFFSLYFFFSSWILHWKLTTSGLASPSPLPPLPFPMGFFFLGYPVFYYVRWECPRRLYGYLLDVRYRVIQNSRGQVEKHPMAFLMFVFIWKLRQEYISFSYCFSKPYVDARGIPRNSSIEKPVISVNVFNSNLGNCLSHRNFLQILARWVRLMLLGG